MQSKMVDLGKKSGFKVHPVSMGTMRFPADDGEAVKLIRKAIDSGLTYIDTSRGYGDSEEKLGKALKDGYREKVILSTKWAPWIKLIEEGDDSSAQCMYKRICEQLKRLDTDYLDFYQVWNINMPQHYELATRQGGMLDGIRRAMNEGLVRHTGFTTHDTPKNVLRYIDEADWAQVILFTYNMLNREYKKCIDAAHAKGIGTIVMNPIGGGMFGEGSEVIKKAVEGVLGEGVSPIEAAHRYLAADENIDTILCGITKTYDIENTLANYAKGPLSEEQCRDLERAMKGLRPENAGFCTGCRYCMPCPQGIKIPEIMKHVFTGRYLECLASAKNPFGWLVAQSDEDRSEYPSKCIKCGKCETQCTQRLKIMDEMAWAAGNLEK